MSSKSTIFLMIYEIIERYGLYGMKSVFVVFAINKIALSESKALSIFHILTFLTYFFGIIGGFIGDKYNTKKYQLVIFTTLFYIIGYFILIFSNVYIAVIIISISAGFVKPIIVSFVGDQFKLPEESNAYQIVLNLFFFAVNLGSALSMIITPYVFYHYGQTIAFLIPMCLIIFSLVIFLLGKKYYKIIPYKDTNFVKPNKFIILITIFLFLSVFFVLLDQMFSVVITQSKLMNCNFFGFKIIPLQISIINPIFALMITPFFTILYRYLNKTGYKITIYKKIQVGMFFSLLCFLTLVSFEYFLIYEYKINILYQIISFLFITIGEILIIPSGIELAYISVPNLARCKSVAFFFLSVCIGNAICSLIIYLLQIRIYIFICSIILCVISIFFLHFLFKIYNK